LNQFYKNIVILHCPAVLEKQSKVHSSRVDGEIKQADSSHQRGLG